jgi:hypothetical protein
LARKRPESQRLFVNKVTENNVTAKIPIAAITAPKNIISPDSIDILLWKAGAAWRTLTSRALIWVQWVTRQL